MNTPTLPKIVYISPAGRIPIEVQYKEDMIATEISRVIRNPDYIGEGRNHLRELSRTITTKLEGQDVITERDLYKITTKTMREMGLPLLASAFSELKRIA